MKDIELKLISELMTNCRRSDRELAKTLGVSQPTVSRTIKLLEKEGIVKEYTMIPDLQKLGFQLLALTFIKLKQGLSAKQLEEARVFAKEHLTKELLECIMVERGLGLGYNGVFISYYKDYSSYLELRKWLSQFDFLDLQNVESFIISLNDIMHYRTLTFSKLAQHITQMTKRE